MTELQIKEQALSEDKRANAAKEAELQRSNKAKEQLEGSKQAETKRSNSAKEKQAKDELRFKKASKMADTISNSAKAIGGIISPFNHPEWYMKDEAMAKAAGNLVWNTPLGTPVSQPIPEEGIAGALTLLYKPSYGNTKALDLATRRLYTYVRYANSGHANYEATDLMMTELAIESIFEALTLGIRVLGIANYYTAANRYNADVLIAASGFSANSVRRKLSDLRTYINSSLYRLEAFNLPKCFSLTERRAWMNGNFFKDQDSARAQVYAFTPLYFHKFNADHPNGTALEPILWGAESFERNSGMEFHTVEAYMDMVDSMFSAIENREDALIMNGDIAKAFGSENLYHAVQIPYDYKIQPVYDKDACDQIRNTIAYPIFRFSDAIDKAEGFTWVIQSEGDHVFKATDATPDRVAYRENAQAVQTITSYKAEVDTGKMFSLTRLRPVSTGNARLDETTDYVVLTAGSEIVCGYSIWWIRNDGPVTQMFSDLETIPSVDFRRNLIRISEFDNHPFMIISEDSSSHDGMLPGDIEEFALADPQTMANIHNVAMLSELNVPYTFKPYSTGGGKRK